MSSTSETGHAKNVALFQNLISICTGFGVKFNPTKPSSQLANLLLLQTNAKAALTAVKSTATTFGKLTNIRQQVFSPLKKLSTRLIAALAASDVQKEIVADAVTINKKIQGERATKQKPTPPPADPKEEPKVPSPKKISSSQQSYDLLIDHFKKLILLLTQEANYAPNEPELTVASLNTLLAGMETANTNVINAETAYSNALITRNDTLYNPVTGMLRIVSDVKNYVKSIFNARSPQYKQLTALKFKQVP